MFIHFGMSTYVDLVNLVCCKATGDDSPTCYAPDRLDVDQWVSVARDAGMKYAVLTAKHISGFCLWPSRHTDYTVAHAGNTTNVVEVFVKACEQKGVLPGLYYSSYDNHHRFGSRTRSDFTSREIYEQFAKSRPPFGGLKRGVPRDDQMPYTTSHYQSFQTAQMTELLTEFGPLMEVWIDHPEALGRGYRTYLYDQIAQRQPDALVMMNNGTPSDAKYDLEYAWPSDLIAMERGTPQDRKREKYRRIEGRDYYLPVEACDSIAPIRYDWFHVPGDESRPVEDLASQFQACRQSGANFLLNVPPDRHGVIPEGFIQTLRTLRIAMAL
jgi:alpha-L-fucosidase